MKKIMFAAFAAMSVAGAFAAATVKNVTVRQQWPWSGKVIIDFSLADPDDGLHDVKLELKNGTEEIDVIEGSVSGAVKDLEVGGHRLVWDPSSLGQTDEKAFADFTATVSVADDPKKFMVLDLSGGSTAEQIPVTFASHPPKAGWAADSANYTTKLVLRRIDAGTYTIGSPDAEVGHVALREPLRQMTLSKGYYLAIFPTTNKQYEQIAGARPTGSTSSDDSPAYKVSLAMLRGENAHLKPADGGSWPKSGEGSFFANFNARVSLGEDLAGYRFDVPSGAQWEIACRAGTTTAWYNGLDNDAGIPDFATRLGEIARHSGNRTTSATPVTTRQPNSWGFYDFIGNTREWVRDFFPVDVTITDWRMAVNAVDGVVRWTANNTGCAYTRGGYEWCGANDVRTAQWSYVGYGTPTATGSDDHELGFRIACTYLP